MSKTAATLSLHYYLKRLEVSQTQNVPVVGAAPAFKLENAIKLLRKFNEQNVEEYHWF